MPSGFFITGTDTGVGKTLISCALLRAFSNTGKRAIGMKPVAAGCEPNGDNTLRCQDVEMLLAAGNVEAPPELVCPYSFAAPIAPHIAAAQSGIHIELPRIDATFKQLSKMADITIVEGVGGFRVPLNPAEDTGDLAKLLGLPVILVVGIRLGCLNHALLTAQSIMASGLHLSGWIANQIDQDMLYPAENIQALVERLPAPLLATVAHSTLPNAEKIALQLPASYLLSTL